MLHLFPVMKKRTLSLVLLVVCAACKAQPQSGEARQNADAISAELASLKLSETCADAAEKFWRRGRYEQIQGVSGYTDSWSYMSHYNTRAKKCYIAVNLYMVNANGDQQKSEQIFDAIDGLPIAVLRSHASQVLELLKPNSLSHFVNAVDDEAETITPDNVARFRRLMTE